MPRASDYLLEGYTYHLTQRCHNRQFLLGSAMDRDVYREWMRQGVKRHGVPVYGFCLTHDHTHILLHVDSVDDVSRFMHLASGATAKRYNLRKGRTGSMWQHPYHCTIVEDGRHLLNCLTYINLNMVRAGAVSHPEEWRWCSHDELIGKRRRYTILNVERLLQSLDVGSEKELKRCYTESLEERLGAQQLSRERHWTESLAVGSKAFVESTTQKYTRRWTFAMQQVPHEDEPVWAVREERAAYNAILRP